MSCNEYERLSEDVDYYRRQINHLLFLKKLHGPLDEPTTRSANEVASALARASNELHRHDNHCNTCRRAGYDRNKQLQFTW
jgi:hypothetical protein